MIPLSFMDGATVMGWSKVAWALTFGTVTFLWWQLLLNQNHSYVEAMEQTNVQVVLATVVVFMLTTGGLWSYFRFRPERAEEVSRRPRRRQPRRPVPDKCSPHGRWSRPDRSGAASRA